MDKPLVSIIMPVYKSEEFIKESILSVQNQSYHNIELICVNDGTPDKAFEICKEMQKTYNNIKLLENEKNMGLEFTRNYGISEACGKYILFLDSDDLLEKNTVESIVAAAEDSETDIVLFGYFNVVDGKEIPADMGSISNGKYTVAEFSRFLLGDMPIGSISNVGTKLYRTEFIINNELKFDRKYKYHEDGGFIFNALNKTDKIYVINKPFYKYIRRNSGSIMSSYRQYMFTGIVTAREIIKDIFIKNHVWEDGSKERYYKDIFGVMLDSLLNEEKFGDADSFKKECENIR